MATKPSAAKSKPSAPKPNTSQLSDLPTLELAIVQALAMACGTLGQTKLLALLISRGHKAPNNKRLDLVMLKEALTRLSKLKLIARAGDNCWTVSPSEQCALLLQLAREGKVAEWMESLREASANNHSPFTRIDVRDYWKELFWSALLAQEDNVLKWIGQLHRFGPQTGLEPLAGFILSHPSGHPLMEYLQPKVQALLLEDLFAISASHLRDCSQGYAYAKAHREQLSLCSELLKSFFIQAMLRGDWTEFEALQKILPEEYRLAGTAARAVLTGRFAEATTIFDSIIKQQRKITKKRKGYIPSVWGPLYCVACLGDGTAERLQMAQIQIEEGLKLRRSIYEDFKPILAQLLSGQPMQTLDLRFTNAPTNLLLDGVFQLLTLYWRDTEFQPAWKPTLANEITQLHERGYHWVAAELDCLRAKIYATGLQLPNWHAEHQQVPLVNAFIKEESWQRALNALVNWQKPAAQAKASQQRIAWLLTRYGHSLELEPREQKCSAKGVWTKGRPIALRRLYEASGELPNMTPQDLRVAQSISLNHGYYSERFELDALRALPHLINHPAVFWHNAQDCAIDVVAGEITLQMQERTGEIQLKLEPELDFTATVEWQSSTPTRLAVFVSTPEIRHIRSILGTGLTVPSSAKAQLVEAMKAVAPHIAIHSDLPELAAHIPSQAADTTLYAHLLPLNDGLRLQFLQRPLPDGSWFPPGRGPANVVGEVAGVTTQAVRSLKAEHRHLAKVLSASPSLAEAQQSDTEQDWQISHPETCLELLSELKALGDEQVQLVWPQGERMRLNGNRSLQQMRLQVRKQGEWFEADGDITLDDGRVLALRELLELMRDSTGRFLKLGNNDYLALTNSFRKRLQELNAFAESNSNGGLRINPLAAPALAELAAEVGQLEADAAWREQVKKLDGLAKYNPKLPTTLQAELRDYQLQGFQWLARLAHWGVGACLADDMGLGKTVQTLALLLLRARGGPALVVAPLSVALNWVSEAQKFAPTLKLHSYNNQRSLEELGAFDVVIASYGMLQQDAEQFAAQHWHTVALDEAQAIKNAATKRSQAAMALNADFKMLASGTPVENHLGELWNLFRFINPGLLGSKERFAQRFSNPIENGNTDARAHLKKLIQPFILRRTKTQVLQELPARTEITLQVELSDAERHLYEALRQQAVATIAAAGKKNQPMQVLAEITKLRRFCCNPKLALKNTAVTASKLTVFAETLEELLANKHKALVFSQFVDHLTIVREYLEAKNISYQYLDGATPANQRKKAVDNFQAGEGDVFLISLKAGGTGLNLTAADYVIHLDPWWNPAVEDQASDRAHRLGQQRPVTIYRLVTQHTIEEKIISLHTEKRDLADSLLDGGDVAARLDTAALLNLLKEQV